MAWAEETSPGRWRGRYTAVRGGERVRLSVERDGRTVIFSSKAEARRVASADEVEARSPGALDRRAGRMTWGAWQQVWWPRRKIEAGTERRDESRRRVHVEPRWAHRPLDEIEREEIQEWVDSLTRSGLSASTVHKIYHLFSASMKAAALARRIPISPCASIELPELPLADERYLTREEVEQLVHHLDRPWSTLVLLLAGTGMRWGELAALHWQRVHLADHRIDVQLAWDAKSLAYKAPKDHERRSVPVLDWIEGVIVDHKRRTPPGVTCGVTHPRSVGIRCSSSLVIPGRTGGPVSYNSFQKGPWERAVGYHGWTDGDEVWRTEQAARAKVGKRTALDRRWVPGEAGIAPCTIHDLRHTYASWLLQDGVTIEELSDLLGHASIKTTQRYAHLAPERWQKIRDRLAGRGPAVERDHSGSEVIDLRRAR